MKVANIQRFCMHDGPGVRTTVFLKGCPLKCFWCHNKETQSTRSQLLYYSKKCIMCGECLKCKQNVHLFSDTHSLNRDLCTTCGECARFCPTNALEICGEDYSIDYLFEIIKRDEPFYRQNGGVTLSGGEPFAQAEDTLALLKICKENGINTAAETCGYFNSNILKRAVPLCDLFLWDIKDTDPKRHKENTGVDNELILKNLYLADDMGAKILIRCILLNGVNTNAEHYKNIAEIAGNLKNCVGVEFLPYHTYGDAKQLALGFASAASEKYIPTSAQIASAKEYLIKN